MFFDKSYVERICSPDILADDRHKQSINNVVNDLTIDELIKQLEQRGLRYEFEERSAILEYDGGLTREEAERQALQEIHCRTTQTFRKQS